MKNAWVGVASREHVTAAVEGGFCQLSHGKEAPLRKLQAGDHIVYYAPREKMRSGDPVQGFVALGEVEPGEPYQAGAAGGFRPFRKAVRYHEGDEAPIRSLLPKLSFTRGRDSWGQAFRRGLFQIEAHDLQVIAAAMKIGISEK